MAKILLAVAAALIGFAAVTGLPAVGSGLPLEQQLDQTDLALPPLGWPNATEILQAIEQALQTIQDKIQQVSDEVQDAVRTALHKIEDAALALADKWNALIQEWVDKANKAGVDIRDCIDGQNKTIAQVAEQVQEDAEQCLADPILNVFDELNKVKETVPKAKALLQAAMDKAAECADKGNAFLVGACLAGSMPAYQVKAAALVASALLHAGLAGAKAAVIAPSASLCTATAYARGGAEASAIVDSTISCIKGKLGQF